MEVSLNPEVQKFIDEQIKAGQYRSAQDVVEEALQRMIYEETDPLDGKTLAAIDESEDQIEKGQYRSWKEVSEELHKEFLGH